MVADYSGLRASIADAVEHYEDYKSQSLSLARINVSASTIDLAAVKKGGQSKQASNDKSRQDAGLVASDQSLRQHSRSVPGDRAESHTAADNKVTGSSGFATFIAVADNYENANYNIDLAFLITTLDFLRLEHPQTSNSLQKSMKVRHTEKRNLWFTYAKEMQGLARAYNAGRSLPVVTSISPLSSAGSSQVKLQIKERRLEISHSISKLDSQEKTCAESIFSALTHLHSQALKDAEARYSMTDPIHDKITPVFKHNERIRTFNQLVKFVTEDLRTIERSMPNTGDRALSKKGKKGPGVFEAIQSLTIDEYPPYK